jgi:uncharacterized FlaG/YvyC family protein
MLLAGELINDNGISAIALAFFGALFSGLALLFQQVWQSRRNAIQASNEAKKAAANTQGVANGFAGSMGRKLDAINESVQRLDERLDKHIEFHLNKEKEDH